MKILTVLVLISGSLVLFADERTNRELNPKRLAAAKPELERLTAEAIDSYREGRTTKVETAASLARLSTATNISREVKFLMLSGAFNLYVDARATNDAKRICLQMAFKDGFHRRDVVSLMAKKRVTFGLVCPHGNSCPLLVDTLYLHECENRKVRNAIPARWTDLALGEKTFSLARGHVEKSAEVDVQSPWEPKQRQRIGAVALDVLLNGLNGLRARLYHSKSSGRLFRVDLFGDCGKLWNADSFEERLSDVCQKVTTWLGEDIGDACVRMPDAPGEDFAVSVTNRHAALVARSRAPRFSNDELLVSRQVVRDNGVSRVAIEGFVDMDIHGDQRIRLEITDLANLQMAWTEGGGAERSVERFLKGENSPFRNMPSVTNDNVSAGYGLAWVGRAFEFGLYGTSPNDEAAGCFYQKAAGCGNASAAKWRAGRHHSICSYADDSGLQCDLLPTSVFGLSISLLTLGLDYSLDRGSVPSKRSIGFASLVQGMDGRKFSYLDDVWGVQTAVLLNFTQANTHSLQLSSVCNGLGQFSDSTGFQIGCIGNFMEACSCYDGLQFGGVFNACASPCVRMHGLQVAGGVNAMADGSVLRGGQLAGVRNAVALNVGCQLAGLYNQAQEADGVQLAGSCNAACLLKGVQLAGIANLALDRFEVNGEGRSKFMRLNAVGSGDASGLQLAVGCNYVKGRMSGAQISCFNWAESMQGVQIGLINYIGDARHKFLPIVNWNF